MKNIFFSVLFVAGILSASAQSAYDVINYSHNDLALGTARYSGMAGAMGAFGGDASSMRDNPAGIGVYRRCDLSFTPNLYLDNDNELGINVNNFGAVINFGLSGEKKGYVTSSLGISYDRLKNFSRSSLDDFYDEYGKAIYYNTFTEEGGIGEWNFSYGVNLSNRVYLGIGLGVATIDYKQKTDYQSAVEQNDYYVNELKVDGSGINFKVGAIFRPADFMRIGVALHTPTYYSDVEEVEYIEPMDDGSWSEELRSYDFRTPLEFQASLGFVIGKKALVGVEYGFKDYGNIKIKSGNPKTDRDYDYVLGNEAKVSHTIKIGTEIIFTEKVCVRGGFAYVSEPTRELYSSETMNKDIPYSVGMPKSSVYGTLGFGYKAKVFYFDVAYVHKVENEDFYEYMPIDSPVEHKLQNKNITATFGWKF